MKHKYMNLMIVVIVFISCLINVNALNSQNEVIIEISDQKGVWKDSVNLEIFKISYNNNQSTITIHSDGDSKVIAPGSENSYTFKITNISELPVNYTLDTLIQTSYDISIPFKYRIKRYDGTWIVGNENDYVQTCIHHHTNDKMTLGPNSYSYYTIDWVWPYESCNDEYDTYLGNMAVDKDIALTMKLNISANVNENNATGGIINTGDDYLMYLHIVLLNVSVIVFIVVIKYVKNDSYK